MNPEYNCYVQTIRYRFGYRWILRDKQTKAPIRTGEEQFKVKATQAGRQARQDYLAEHGQVDGRKANA